MFTAETADGKRVEASPRARAVCPTCRGSVLAKCGQLVSWHWAHEDVSECDLWAEPDSQWHREWQAVVPIERREVVRGPHRADVVTPSGLVVELQRKALSAEEVEEREKFYGEMVWIVDCVDPALNYLRWKEAKDDVVRAYHLGIGDGFSFPEEPRAGLDLRKRGTYHSFRWKHARKWVSYTKKTTYLDCGSSLGLLQLKKVHLGPPCGGWGYMRPRSWMEAQLNRVVV